MSLSPTLNIYQCRVNRYQQAVQASAVKEAPADSRGLSVVKKAPADSTGLSVVKKVPAESTGLNMV